MIGIDNLIDIIIKCISHPKAARKTFLVCDGEDVSTSNLLKLIALFWCVFVVLCLLIPGQTLDGFNFQYVHAISLFVFLIIGYLVYINKNK